MILRGIGFVFLALGGLALGADVWRSVAAGQLILQPLGETWYTLDQGSLNLAQAVIQRYVWPAIWDPGVTTLLLWPTWVLPGVLGGLLLLWSRR